MKRCVLFLVCLAIISLTAQATDMYRWVDSKGVVHYSDTPDTDADKVDTRKFAGPENSGNDLPYETRRAKENFPVTLYVGEGCGSTCAMGRDLLNKRGIPYAEKSLKTRAEIEEFKKLTNAEGIPVLAIGKSYLNGFQAERWNSELDIAGYPKTAGYRKQTAPPSEAPAQ